MQEAVLTCATVKSTFLSICAKSSDVIEFGQEGIRSEQFSGFLTPKKILSTELIEKYQKEDNNIDIPVKSGSYTGIALVFL